MANNCLVTKLKGTVDADLERLGMIRIHLDEGAVVTEATDRTQMIFGSLDGVTPIHVIMDNITGGCHFTSNNGTEDRGTEITIYPSQQYGNYIFFISKGSCDIFVTKAHIVGYNGGSIPFNTYDRVSFDLDEMKYYDNFGKYVLTFCSELPKISGNQALLKVKGSIDNVKGTGCTSIMINGCVNVTGNLSAFLARNIQTLTYFEAYHTGCSFDVSVLDNLDCSNIISFRFPNNVTNADFSYLGNINTNISLQYANTAAKFVGSIESYAQKRASLYGAGSNKTNNFNLFSEVTYEGVAMKNRTLGDSTTFSWDAQGNITSFE